MDNISVTAIVIQTMVYGNMNTRSGSGIAYTRDPMTGQKLLTGDYLINADGDEIVAGIRKTIKLNELFIHQPSVFEKLMDISSILENHYKDMQCIEFTVQNGTLFILETSKGKRNPASAIKMVVSMVQENMINEREALMRIDPSYMNSFGNQSIDPTVFEGDEENKSIEYLKIGNGIGISNGIASGRIAFDSVVNITNEKEKSAIILCIDNDYPSLESNTELKSVNGILMLQGNALSFPSIAMKRLGRPVLINTKNMLIDLTNKCLISRNGTVYHEGDYITIDGNTGIVYQGNLPIFNHENDFSYYTILKWADQYKRMKILPNIDSDKDIKALHTMKSVDGIGEFNTEFLFFRTEKDLELLQLSILEIDKTKRTFYIRQLYTSQKEYFVNLFIRQLTILHDKSIIFRLINNDICRFLPNSMDNSYFSDVEKLSKLLLINASECFSRITALHRNIDEQCDIYEELLRMHCKSVLVGIVEANKLGLTYFPTFSIQHMFSHREVEKIISQIDDAMKEMIPEYPNVLNIPFAVGCDLKVPRACIRIEKLVSIPEIRVISIDSNALTAAIFGIDHSKMIQNLTYYLQNHILAHDPFDNIDLHGVGSLISAVVEKAKSVNSKVEIGVHGNHCGNSKSIFFFDKLKIDFISCSSDQLPCAKVAAARSNIIQMQRDKEQRYEKFWNMIEGGNILY
jgi:pyruvate,orthophosphate dikinase